MPNGLSPWPFDFLKFRIKGAMTRRMAEPCGHDPVPHPNTPFSSACGRRGAIALQSVGNVTDLNNGYAYTSIQ